MNTMKLLNGRKGFVLAAIITTTLAGCTTYVEHQTVYHEQPPPPAPPPPPPVAPVQVEVVIRTESDFYEPLTPYGHWEVIGPYGRCWVPARVDPDWRPYCNGHWERTEDGWFWVSDEPWGWATYHYGRWDFDPRFGWYWVPQTQWAPAWVCWRRGDGYVGWAPLSPAARFERDTVIVEERTIQPRAYVFVEERRFLEPVRPRTVIVNNTTIVNKTVNITNIKVVNKTVINEGPRTQVIQQATGRSVRPVAVRELRRKSEAEIATKQKAIKPGEGNVATTPTPGLSQVPPAGQNAAQEAQKRRELEKQKQIEAQQAARDKQAQVDAQRREQEAQKKAQAEADRRAKELEQQRQIEAQHAARAKEIEAQHAAAREKQAQLDADRRAQQLEQQRQADAQKAQAEAQKRVRQQEAQMEQQRREQEAKAKADRAAEERAKTKQANKEKAEQKKASKKAVEEQAQDPAHQPPPQ